MTKQKMIHTSPVKKEKQSLALASTQSALYSSGGDSDLNPSITPSFMKIKYDAGKKKNVWELVSETIAAFDTNEVVSGALKHIVAVLYRNMYIVGKDLDEEEIKFWDSLKILSFDINRVPKSLSLIQIAQSIGINLIKGGNAFPYITKWGPSWTGAFSEQIPLNIDVHPVTSIDYDVINREPKFFFKKSMVENNETLAQEDLDHIHIPKSDDQIFAVPPFYSIIAATQLKNEVDQSIWNVLCSFIAFILHIIVNTSRGDKGPGIRQKRISQKQLDAIALEFKGTGKNRAIATTSDLEAKFLTMDPAILASAPIYDPLDKRIDQALGKIFFGQTLLDSIAYAGLVEAYFQEPVEQYLNSLFLTIGFKNNMDMTRIPEVKFSPVAWHEESMIVDTDRILHEVGGLSTTDFVERRGLNFDDQMRKIERELEKYPWLAELLVQASQNKDNQDKDQKTDDNKKTESKYRKTKKKRS